MIATFFGRAFTSALAFAFIAGCSGSPSPGAPTGNAGSLQSASATRWLPGLPLSGPRGWPIGVNKSHPILFIADPQGSVVRMYDPNTPNPSPEGSITDGISNPSGIAVDSKGALYVNNVGSGTITVYSQGKSSPRLTIPTTGFYGIAVDSKGDIFASTGGTVAGYRPGKKKPFETIGDFDNLVGIAVDGKNSVWAADDTASKVYIIPAGTKQVKDAGLKGLDSPIGLAFGTKGVLYVANFANAGPPNVEVFAAGSKKPSYKITTGIASPTLNGVTGADTFFQSNQTDNVVGYKQGQKTPFSTITGNSDPLGIAAFPLVKK